MIRSIGKRSPTLRCYSTTSSPRVKLYSKEITSQSNTNQHTSSNPNPHHILMLHGLLGSHNNWGLFTRMFLQHHQAKGTVVPLSLSLLDLRNHGNSSNTDEHTYELMSEDLKEYMDTKGIHNASIIGHSMGGKLAMYFALHHPERVHKLVVIDSAPAHYDHNHNVFFHAMKAVPLDTITSKNEAEEILKKTIHDKGERSYLLNGLSNTSGQWKWKFNLEVLYKSQYLVMGFPLITVKPFSKASFFLAATQSHRLNDEYIPSVKNLFPNNQIVRVEGGHFLHAQHPALVSQLVHDFVFTS